MTFIFSQSNDYVYGKIINSKTLQPVPFATVLLKYNQLGVFANAEGDFKIIHNPKFQTDSIVITCIGFKRHSLPFNKLNENEVNKILLTPDIYGLGEVKVIARKNKISSTAIISRAIRKIKNNYPKNPFNYISYYRDYQKKREDYINLNEAIVQTLDNGFSRVSTENKYRLLDFRKNMEFQRMNLSPYYDTIVLPYANSSAKTIPRALLGDQYGNELFILIVHDAIRNYRTRSFSFVDTFSENFLFNHNFSEPHAVYNNELLLYKINFKAKPRIAGDSLQISGSIYIQPKDYSIHKLEYSCAFLNAEKEKKEIFKIDIEYGYENSVDSLMCLKYISFNNLFNVIDSTDNNYFKILDSHWVPSSPFRANDFSNLTFVTEFNNKIDPKSANDKGNYDIMLGNRKATIIRINVDSNKLYIKIKDDKFRGSLDKCRLTLQNIKDTDGKLLNKRKTIELYQFRELFVQEYNKSPAFQDSCYVQYLPLEQNCISRSISNDRYWMNTPEKIKNNKVIIHNP